MKKSLKIFLIILSIILVFILSFVVYIFVLSTKIHLLDEKLNYENKSIIYYDINNEEVDKEIIDNEKIDIKTLKDYTINAFISTEDKRFYSHNGIDYKGIFRAIFNNIKSFSYKEGASTITQQLIKNTHLNNEKTFDRKLKELILARKLENNYTKEQILEMYLNSIYFGSNTFGISNASKLYFNKNAKELSINESAVLAGLIKAPTYYSPFNNLEKCINRKNIVLKNMLNENYITENEYNFCINEKITFYTQNKNQKYSYFDLVKNEMQEILENNNIYDNKIKVYTNFDKNLQENIKNNLEKYTVNSDKTVYIIDKNHRINAFISTCLDTKRNVASTIKPLLVYAPALEENIISPCTIVEDKKTNFNGYIPKNYNDKEYGNISCREAFAVSSNISAVKILNSTGIEKSKQYLKNTDITFSEKDNGLSIALGGLTYGETLKNIVSGYSIFLDNGFYASPTTISKIEFSNYTYYINKEKHKIFSSETSYLISNMANYSVKNGTSKKLNKISNNLCGKTGTNGNSKGNTDAYSITYNTDYVLGIRFSAKNNTLMANNITGGTEPTNLACDIWNNKKFTFNDFAMPNGIIQCNIDKESYKKDNKILLADEIAPKETTICELFNIKNIPKENSNRFLSPKIENLKSYYNNKYFCISLCQTQYINYCIIKENNGIESIIFDSKNNANNVKFIDKNLLENTLYSYYVLPYFETENKIYYRQKQLLKQIKTPTKNVGDWWNDSYKIKI